MKGYLYLLRSKNCKRPYLGSTINIKTRLHQHNNNKARATANKGPWEMIQYWEFPNIAEARSVEYKIKKRKLKITEEIIKNFLNKNSSVG